MTLTHSHSQVNLEWSKMVEVNGACKHNRYAEPGIAKGKKKEEISWGVWGHAPQKILKVETKICVLWGILGANLKISSTLKFTMNISFVPSICIYRSIILIFIEKGMLIDFFPTENVFFRDFQLSFPRESSFLWRIPGSGYEKIWLKSLFIMSHVEVVAMQDGWLTMTDDRDPYITHVDPKWKRLHTSAHPQTTLGSFFHRHKASTNNHTNCIP